MLANDVKPSVNASRSPDERRQLKHGPRQEKNQHSKICTATDVKRPKANGSLSLSDVPIFFFYH